MERGFYQEDLEQLLKQKADQYKMYPSDRVWKGVYRSLHTRRKWYWFSFVLFLTAISYYAIVDLISPSANKAVARNTASSSAPSQNTEQQKAVIIPFTSPAGTGAINSGAAAHQKSFIVNPELNSGEQIAANGLSDLITDEIIGAAPVYDLQTGMIREEVVVIQEERKAAIVSNEVIPYSFVTPAIEQVVPQYVTGLDIDKSVMAKESEEISAEDKNRVNWLQEYAVYELAPPALKRLSWQLSFSPTMNYRKLTGSNNANISSDIKNIPIALNIAGDPDKLLNHKPAIGFELGTHFLYALNKTFLIKAGFQFNYSRYDIQAYSSNTERATIALNSVGLTNDTIATYTRLRNFGGDAVQDLQNQYFQLSAPIGFEMRLLGNGKLQLNVAGTLQPTYLLNRNTYLITTDYKNYTKEPSLVRRWNLNSGAEAFISYKTGDLKWQVGPQFRYQLLSSYISEYPIREHLMEYGIKIGVTKTIR